LSADTLPESDADADQGRGKEDEADVRDIGFFAASASPRRMADDGFIEAADSFDRLLVRNGDVKHHFALGAIRQAMVEVDLLRLSPCLKISSRA